jgi:N-succinyldiaminopimelate aminotransferase
MNRNLRKLHPYPFERLSELKSGIQPPSHLDHISLSIGEPKHSAPNFVKKILRDSIDDISRYPTTKGSLELREAISSWLEARFQLTPGSINPDTNVLPVCGTREAIFSFTQAAIDNNLSQKDPLVVIPNPFYQIYEGASILASAEVHLLSCGAREYFKPDFERVAPEIWERCQLLQLCSPGNPTGAIIEPKQMELLIELADRYDFIISSDECYSEVYLNEAKPPIGLLQVCKDLGRHCYSRCVVFHSLSKRSNLPGLRSGFVAGDQNLIECFLKYRTYHGSSMSLPVQKASIAAWSDELHTIENRSLYREKFNTVTAILGSCMNFPEPEASFYLWPETPIDDLEFSVKLYAQQNVTVLPGQFLSRETVDGNPGRNRIRLALVAQSDECLEAALRIKQFVASIAQD